MEISLTKDILKDIDKIINCFVLKMKDEVCDVTALIFCLDVLTKERDKLAEIFEKGE